MPMTKRLAQSISVIFFFNVLAAILFPIGQPHRLSTTSGEAFGIFCGTAVNDTSSVTAAAATWDSMWGLGTATLDKAVTVKLTASLAIIPITLVLAFLYTRKGQKSQGKGVSLKSIFPFFILYFIAASLLTTVAVHFGVDASVFSPIKTLSKFFIVLAMAAIGLNTDIVKLIKTGGAPLALGACCWVGHHRHQPSHSARYGPLVTEFLIRAFAVLWAVDSPYENIKNDPAAQETAGSFFTLRQNRPKPRRPKRCDTSQIL